MASNTEILIKRSLSTDKPASLLQGELGFSYSSNTLFIGTSAGDDAFEIAGYRDYSANFINGVGTYGNTTTIPVITVSANGQVTAVDTAVISTSLGINADSGGPSSVDLLTQQLDVAGGAGITSSVSGQTITVDVDDTVVRSNTAIALQTIDGDIQISGNLVVHGNTTTVDVQTLNIADPLIYLASDNYSSDVVDIGFVGNYYDGSTQRHAGVFRHAGDKQFYIFDNYDKEPTANVVNPADASFHLATLNSNLTGNTANISTTLSLGSSSYLYANGGAYFAQQAYFYSGAKLQDDLLLNNGHKVQFENGDNTASANIYNSSAGSANNVLTVESAQTTLTGNINAVGATFSGTLRTNADVFVPNLPNATTLNLVYYDTANGRFSYANDNALTPTSIANGAYSLEISGSNGLLTHNGAGLQLNNGAILKDTAGNALAFGENAGTLGQGNQAVAIGDSAGYNSQGDFSVAIGYGAGNVNQNQVAVAIGLNAGMNNQGYNGIAIGNSAGSAQGTGAIAFGYSAGSAGGNYSISIGQQAGAANTTSMGADAIAIGRKAGFESAYAGSIILNASGNDLSSTAAGLYINPVRYTAAQDATYDGIIFYNSNTKEVRYSYALDGGTF